MDDVRLEKIWTNPSVEGGTEVRLDWSNDRHQMVVIKERGRASDIVSAVHRLFELLVSERKDGKI